MNRARWPNALLWTEDWWDREVGWAKQAEGTSCGTNVDAGTASPAAGEPGHQSLAGTGVSFDGCNMIVNNEHWKTRRYTVAGHVAGTGNFTYAHQDASDNPLCAKCTPLPAPAGDPRACDIPNVRLAALRQTATTSR